LNSSIVPSAVMSGQRRCQAVATMALSAGHGGKMLMMRARRSRGQSYSAALVAGLSTLAIVNP
jgi:hypothetical protein